MIRAIVHEAAALVALTLFVAAIAVWAQILGG